ncbi:MAG: hypothetical protein GKC04_09750 [Methanomicrobiales archaeon]|nr:hypothetical protein [Methanomicrobiales archaeon]
MHRENRAGNRAAAVRPRATPRHRIAAGVPCMLLLLALAAGCVLQPVPSAEQVVTGTGTVVFIPREGGFFGIAADSGVQYWPEHLDPAYRAAGVRVIFTARLRPDRVAPGQWGTPVDIIDIRPAQEPAANITVPPGDGNVTAFGRVAAAAGGTYIIVSDDGIPYLPANLDPAFRVEGLYVVFSGETGAPLPSGAIPVTISGIATAEPVP